MTKKRLIFLISKIGLQIRILRLQLQKQILKQRVTIPNNKILGVVVHHGAGDWNFKRVNLSHKNSWGFKSSLGYYCGYHKFIEFDGTLHIARRDGERGAHTVGNIPHYYNDHFIGICLQGNFEKRQPTGEQLRFLKKELNKYAGLKIIMHREVSNTLCPGKNLVEWTRKFRNN